MNQYFHYFKRGFCKALKKIFFPPLPPSTDFERFGETAGKIFLFVAVIGMIIIMVLLKDKFWQ